MLRKKKKNLLLPKEKVELEKIRQFQERHQKILQRKFLGKPLTDTSYWGSKIPRNEKELDFMMKTMPDNVIIEERRNEFIYRTKTEYIEVYGIAVPHVIKEKIPLPRSYWYWHSVNPLDLYVNPYAENPQGNPYRTKGWIPEVLNPVTKQWRKASRYECRNWKKLIECPFCHTPIAEGQKPFKCIQCNGIISKRTVYLEIEKRVQMLICIIPDTVSEFQEVSEDNENNESEDEII